MYITDHTLHMYSVLFQAALKAASHHSDTLVCFCVTASVTLVSCLIFQSILQCSLHSISQPPHIRYYNWTETHCVHQEYRVWNDCCEAAGIEPEIVLTVKGVYTNPAVGTSEYGLTLRTEVHKASHTPTPLHIMRVRIKINNFSAKVSFTNIFELL